MTAGGIEIPSAKKQDAPVQGVPIQDSPKLESHKQNITYMPTYMPYDSAHVSIPIHEKSYLTPHMSPYILSTPSQEPIIYGQPKYGNQSNHSNHSVYSKIPYRIHNTQSLIKVPTSDIAGANSKYSGNEREDIIHSLKLKYKRGRRCFCCTKYKDRPNFQAILKTIDLSELQKHIIEVRYMSILENIQRRTEIYTSLFFVGHIIITVGSLFVPALLSIQNSDRNVTPDGTNVSVYIYWTTFAMSILVTVFNGILTLFKIDKKYYFLHTTLEKLRSEGWQYFSLTGRYSGHLIGHNIPTHDNQFVYFTHYIEKIKMKQVEEEYYKADEKSAQTPNGNYINSVTVDPELFSPSPTQPLISMEIEAPKQVKDAVNSIIMSQRASQKHIAAIPLATPVTAVPTAVPVATTDVPVATTTDVPVTTAVPVATEIIVTPTASPAIIVNPVVTSAVETAITPAVATPVADKAT